MCPACLPSGAPLLCPLLHPHPPLQLVQALQARPNLLGLDLESVRRMVGYLAASGKSTEEIAQLLQSSL